MERTRPASKPLARHTRSAAPPEPPLHPLLAAQLELLRLRADGTPDPGSWERFLSLVDEQYRESDALGVELSASMRGRARFENLFRIAPIPIIEQDYTGIVEWMQDLRSQGVRDLGERLPDIDAIRAVVPMIRIVAANPAAVRAVGLPVEEMVGPIDPRIVNDGSYPSWFGQLQAVWNGEPEAHAAFVAGTPRGDTFDAESILAAPLIDGEPDFSRAVFTLIDVTPHRDEERRMRETIDAKNRFLASVSHEVRTPLTAILGFARLLDEKPGPADEERRRMVSAIVEQGQEVVDLLEDLLVAARAEVGRIDVIATTIDVREQITRTLQAGGSFTADIRVDVPARSPVAIGDPARVRQILRNLLTNAERYGGAEVAIVASASPGRVHIDVTDDGPGLPPTDWELVFEPYHRAHENPGQPEAVGIGLTISRQLAELMGGSLTYSRQADRSVFRLTLQAAH